MAVKWESMRTLIHRPGQYVGYITQEPDKHNRVYAKIWTNLPYTEPDNAINGMDGFYPVEQLEKHVSSAIDPIFIKWGLPPGYVQAHQLTADEETELEGYIRAGAAVITGNSNDFTSDESDMLAALGADLVSQVKLLLLKAMER